LRKIKGWIPRIGKTDPRPSEEFDMRLIRAFSRSAHCATKRAIRGIKHALVPCVLAALSVCIAPKSSGAEELSSKDRAPVETEVQCALAISPDYRLTIERWAPTGECKRPVRTRVTDRFLGFACLKNAAGRSTCRSFAPPLPSRALDAAGLFHCVEMFLTATDAGIVVTRTRQWVASTKVCDWSPSLEAPVTEVDFGRSEICAGGICIPAYRISTTGKVRLRRLVETGFRQLGVGTMEKWKALCRRIQCDYRRPEGSSLLLQYQEARIAPMKSVGVERSCLRSWVRRRRLSCRRQAGAVLIAHASAPGRH
jgi:hypothetical protein